MPRPILAIVESHALFNAVMVLIDPPCDAQQDAATLEHSPSQTFGLFD
jgi:hypothetical protein